MYGVQFWSSAMSISVNIQAEREFGLVPTVGKIRSKWYTVYTITMDPLEYQWIQMEVSQGLFHESGDREVGDRQVDWYGFVVMKTELSQKAKVHAYWLTYVQTLIYDHKLLRVIERTRLWMQVAEISLI